jgi:hypothetical protein
MYIPRHTIPNTLNVEKNFLHATERLPKLVKYCEQRTNNLNLDNIVSVAWDIALYGSVVRPDDACLLGALGFGVSAGVALFETRQFGSATFRFGQGPLLQCKGDINESVCHTGTWLQTSRLAVLCRDSRAIDTLCNVPADLVKLSSTKAPGFHYLFVDAIQGYWKSSVDTNERITNTANAMSTGHAEAAMADYDAHHWVPEIELLRHVFADLNSFPAALLKAVLLHKEYYDANERRRRESYGFLALRALTWAAIAIDRGRAISVDSEYLPYQFLTGGK